MNKYYIFLFLLISPLSILSISSASLNAEQDGTPGIVSPTNIGKYNNIKEYDSDGNLINVNSFGLKREIANVTLSSVATDISSQYINMPHKESSLTPSRHSQEKESVLATEEEVQESKLQILSPKSIESSDINHISINSDIKNNIDTDTLNNFTEEVSLSENNAWN